MTTPRETEPETESGATAEQEMYAPLFSQQTGDGKEVQAKLIKKIRIYRQFPGKGGRVRRIPMSRLELEPEDEEPFVYNPWETDEGDMEDAFGGGEYYVEPVGHDGRLIRGGHTVMIAGPMKEGIREAYSLFAGGRRSTFGLKDTGDDEIPDQPSPEASMLQKQQELIEKLLEREKKASEDRVNGMNNAVARDDLVAALRDELDEARKTHRTQIDQMISNHRSEIDRRAAEIDAERRRRSDEVDDEKKRARKAIEDMQDEMSSKRRMHEAALQQVKDDARRDVEIERKRWERDLEDERKKRVSEVEETRRRLESRVTELEKVLSETRSRLDKRVEDLSRENLDLRRDLADTPEPPEPPSPTSSGGPVGNEMDPLWYRAMSAWIPPIIKSVSDAMSRRSDQPGQPGQPQQPQLPQQPLGVPMPTQQPVAYAPSPPPPPPPPPVQQQQQQTVRQPAPQPQPPLRQQPPQPTRPPPRQTNGASPPPHRPQSPQVASATSPNPQRTPAQIRQTIQPNHPSRFSWGPAITFSTDGFDDMSVPPVMVDEPTPQVPTAQAAAPSPIPAPQSSPPPPDLPEEMDEDESEDQTEETSGETGGGWG